MRYARDITKHIGGTPLVSINHLVSRNNLVLAKLEMFNPLASVKDRVGLAMIEAAEREGRLKNGGLVVEATSGNTGIALAFVCAIRGYRLVLTMPESMSVERREILDRLGAELVLTPASERSEETGREHRRCESGGRDHEAARNSSPMRPRCSRKTLKSYLAVAG